MITPTLFVGLGTTGTEILKKLRELMYEEYGRGGLSIFRYIAIETDQNMEAELENTNQMKEYERINFVKASVDNFGMINRRLNPKDMLYNKNLDKWLNRSVLTFAKNFTTGAGHIRMAGRLCLWENWREMQETLSTAQGAIHASASIKTANTFLADHFTAKGLQIDGPMVGGSTHIYIIGSLCGGTCSGMLIDMAYYCRDLIDEENGGKIHGMFTMFDTRAANRAPGEDEALTKVRSANCYGGLRELNYYNHPKTTYNVVLPNSTGKVASPDKIPFDETMLVSCSGKDPTKQFTDENGKLDLEGLNLMVALNLFAESVGNTRGLKEAMGINGNALAGFGALKVVRRGETTVMMRNMASFGLTAVWYPKYRIANATASLVGQKVCEDWLGSHIPELTIERKAKEKWREIHDRNIEKLTSIDGSESIKSRIDEDLGRLKKARLNKNLSGPDLINILENFPKDDPFGRRFAEGGEYIKLIKMQKSDCEKAFRSAIEETFNDQLGKIEIEERRGIKDVVMFFEKLDDEIEKEIKKCHLKLPSLSLDEMDFGQLNRVKKSFWLRSLWLQDESVESHQRDIIDKYCDLISGPENSFYEEIRRFFSRSILEGLRAELGFGVSPQETDAPNRRLTIRERFRKIDTNLKDCLDQLRDQYNKAINPKESECVKIVTSNNKNSIAQEAEIRSHQIITDGGSDEKLLDGTTMTGFLQKEHQEIFNQITTTYRSATLKRIQSDDVVTEVQKYVEARDPEITNLADRSNPYQTFDTSNYQPLLQAPPKIIFGRDSTGNVLPQLERKLEFSNSGDCSVDHLLFFYQEEYGFTIDDLRVFPLLEDTYFNDNPLGEYGHSTHKEPDFYDLLLHQKMDRLKWWGGGLAPLVPAVCNVVGRDAFDGLFRIDNGMYVYEYDLDGLAETLALHGDEEGITKLSRSENAEAYDEFVQSVQSKFTELTREQITNIVNQLTRTEPVHTQRRKLNDFYRILLDEIFTGNMSSDRTFADTEVDLEWAFFHQTSQLQEEDTAEEQPDPDADETADEATDATDPYDEEVAEDNE